MKLLHTVEAPSNKPDTRKASREFGTAPPIWHGLRRRYARSCAAHSARCALGAACVRGLKLSKSALALADYSLHSFDLELAPQKISG